MWRTWNRRPISVRKAQLGNLAAAGGNHAVGVLGMGRTGNRTGSRPWRASPVIVVKVRGHRRRVSAGRLRARRHRRAGQN